MRYSVFTSKFTQLIFLPLAIILLLTSTIILTSAAETKPPEHPRHEDTNVILISLQCLRPDHLGTYGYQRETSKNIDKLAESSVLFENAIAQANLTPVAQMSVLTSQYPRVNGMISFEVSKEMVTATTLPAVLKNYGYTTAATHSSPEFFMRYDTKGNTVVNPGDIFSRGFDYYGRTRRGPGGGSIRKAPTEAFKWLQENHDKKFFLWIGSGVIHMPYGATVPKKLQSMYDPPDYKPFWEQLPIKAKNGPAKGSPAYDIFSRVYNNQFFWDFKPIHKLTDDDISYVNGRYDTGVYYTDLFIGQLLALLDSLDLTKKTMIVLHSIHGEDLGEGGRFFHYDVTDTVVKNALLVRFPDDRFKGKRIKEQVQGIDIMPTVLEYLDIPLPHEAQGGSLLPLIKGVGPAPSEFAYIDRMPWWEYTLSKWYLEFQKNDQKAPFSAKELAAIDQYLPTLQASFEQLGYPPGDIAIRNNDWKLIIRKNIGLLNKLSWWSFITAQKHDVIETELYDLQKDPLEMHNIAAAHPERVKTLKEKLLVWDGSIERQKARYNQNDQRLIIPYPE
ncbi:MAG: sulfatase-like hydrolase/transferase [Proteobacteria bacterium]|nr:sulfatase-like hydrolase/transferase [Pseudomonadota bacterium]MBU1715979.1 sulfatase-like hydrolase/transferase [Pseudomonadota bacterium]